MKCSNLIQQIYQQIFQYEIVFQVRKTIFSNHKITTNKNHLLIFFYGKKIQKKSWGFWVPKSKQTRCTL